ncbi:uncharacterized protein K452DRAFT_296595 [Aplosporella prunicola CBS 121167]|uniref:Uncharacterized protein n=1 Tax=Aplosporella prunicola CBS 121167 TaxID=1176127 RepID=A0A6A6BHW3_9PEZI|nr:uncharacterized protein K452DRAFT_296595 [Aplosporella prunicola CBS 121167]KAF2143586.1 hypothetical protein K452DRAFT_296595 [Aplosporella prunicola CBS 121167]
MDDRLRTGSRASPVVSEPSNDERISRRLSRRTYRQSRPLITDVEQPTEGRAVPETEEKANWPLPPGPVETEKGDPQAQQNTAKTDESVVPPGSAVTTEGTEQVPLRPSEETGERGLKTGAKDNDTEENVPSVQNKSNEESNKGKSRSNNTETGEGEAGGAKQKRSRFKEGLSRFSSYLNNLKTLECLKYLNDVDFIY